MKLVTAIVQDKDATKLSNEFVKNNVRATRLATSGGFLRAGNTTFMIAIADERLDDVLKLIAEHAHQRKQFMVPPVGLDTNLEGTTSYPVEVEVGGATVIVQDIEAFHQF